MKILVSGKSDFKYNRTQVLLSGLEQTDGVTLDYHPISKNNRLDKEILSKKSAHADIVYVPPFRHSDVKFIKSVSKAPVVFDALISKYLTRTIDHGKWWTALEKTWRDRAAFGHSDLIIMDTEGHRNYIIKQFGLNPDSVISLPVGVDSDKFYPIERKENSVFKVGFYGGFIPLQGAHQIVKAAKCFEKDSSIEFVLIGDGPEFKNVKRLARKLNLNNVDFPGWLPYQELNAEINSFDICLGIFGDSLKSELVVPNKLYHYSALKKCTITRDTIGVREIFKPGVNIAGVENSVEGIAQAITRLKGDLITRNKIADGAYKLITESYNQKCIANTFLKKVRASLAL